jgi:multiple sugar transport system permease protein
MSGTLLAALPVILIFVIFGKRLVDSIQFSGIK